MSVEYELDAAALRRIVLTLSERLPMTDEFEGSDCAERARKRVAYRSQREHIERWLAEYDAPGYYNRQKPGGGARNFYNRFKCVGGLIWLAEALGVPEGALCDAVDAVRAVPRNPAAECGAFRRVIPWLVIEPLLDARRRDQWRALRGPLRGRSS
jgi:hypothetical protein